VGQTAAGYFSAKGTSSETIAKTAIRKFSSGMERELVPWITTATRQIEESVSKDPRFAEAEKLVRKKKYSQALARYKHLYEERGSLVAGYNMAILLEAAQQFAEALAVLEAIDKRMPESGINGPHFVKNEIHWLRQIIEKLAIIEEYR
jgi:tetratricopeptide (TPR) repeat protein